LKAAILLEFNTSATFSLRFVLLCYFGRQQFCRNFCG